MRLPHLDRRGRDCKLELREGAPVPACIALYPIRQDATYVTERHGIVFNTAIERLNCFLDDSSIKVGTIDLSVFPLGDHTTGICIEMLGLGNNLMQAMDKLGMMPIAPVGFLVPMASKMFRPKEWPSIRRAMREGWPLTIVVSSIGRQRVVAAWTYRMSANFASALAADCDRHSANPAPGGPIEVITSGQNAMAELRARENARSQALCHEEGVPVTRLASALKAA